MSQHIECTNSKYMELALELAKKGKGQVAPNPCVGAVITKGNLILGQGWHKIYGGPHAEIEAIQDAISRGHNLEGSTLWVTLEPCNHYGKTPPCTEAILKHKIKKVIIGTKDPNPRVKGGGIDFLKQHGVEVEVGIKEKECRELIKDFITWTIDQRPYIYLKLAQSLDGKIATRDGDSKWITCKKSRELVHKIRSRVNSILIGGNTFYKDNPKLTVRIKGEDKIQPRAIILTSRLPDPDSGYYLLKNRPEDTIFWTNTSQDLKKIKALEKKGISVWCIDSKDSKLNLKKAFQRLFKEKKCYYVMCEGGSILAQTLINQNLVDEFYLFIAPIILGDERAIPSFSGNIISRIKEAARFEIIESKQIGSDILIHLLPKENT